MDFLDKLNYKDLKNSSGSKSQVRQNEVNTDHCKEVLLPLFEKQGMLYPPFVMPSGLFYDVESGHNRSYTHTLYKPGSPIPCFTISEPVYINDDGSTSAVSGSEFYKVISRMTPNQSDPVLATTLQDVSLNLHRLFTLDPTFQGLNPTGGWFVSAKKGKDNPFNVVMDNLYKESFLGHRIRGKILSGCSQNKNVIRTLSFADNSDELLNQGWGAQVEHKGKKLVRKSVLESRSPCGALVGICNSNGNNFQATIGNHLITRLASSDKFPHNKVNLLVEVYNPKGTPQGLTKQREAFVKSLGEYVVDVLANLTAVSDPKKRIPQIEKVWFPPQLTTEDAGVLYVWCYATKKYKKK